MFHVSEEDGLGTSLVLFFSFLFFPFPFPYFFFFQGYDRDIIWSESVTIL